MDATLDTRPWNLASGALLLAACGPSAPSGETQAQTQAEGSSETPGETQAGECSVDADCPPGYGCYSGYCEYAGGVDGACFEECCQDSDCPSGLCINFMCEGGGQEYDYECQIDADCEALSLCKQGVCYFVGAPADCEPIEAVAIPRAIEGELLALAFVDADDDGADELALADSSALHLFESELDFASVSPQGAQTITAMVGGALTPEPGQDLALLAGDELRIHSSDGVASFGPPAVGASPVLGPTGLAAAELDDDPGAELLVWGSGGAFVFDSGGTSQGLVGVEVGAGAVRGPSLDGSAYVLRSPGQLMWLSLGAVVSTMADSYGQGADPMISAAIAGEWFELDAGHPSNFDGNTLVQMRDPSGVVRDWALSGSIRAMAAVDFDGDGRDSVAVLVDGALVVLHDIALPDVCLRSVATPEALAYLAVGDWDGDGDEELAVGASSGQVWVYGDL